MDFADYLAQLNAHFSHLYRFARKMNELDFAASLSGEFRGMQDAGWATTITAHEVFEELEPFFAPNRKVSKAELRIMLMLYCQLAEAGGVYESLKNMMGVITLKPYLLWPFKDLVRVKNAPRRVIGPNANATFRDLATTAKEIGLSRLSELLELAFSDDIRNAISHADYVIWDDGLRLRNRNGGFVARIPFADLNNTISRGVAFFQLLMQYNTTSVTSFRPPREIVGRLSANFPMPWTVAFDPQTRSFGFRGSSPGPVKTPEFERQEAINARLGGRVLAVYAKKQVGFDQQLESHLTAEGF